MFRATRAFARFTRPASFTPTIPTPSSRAIRPHYPRPLVARFASSSSNPPPPKQPIDREHERKVAQEKLKSNPSEVSVDSTTRSGWEQTPSLGTTDERVGDGLQHDIGIVKDTFRLSTVPRESHILGLAGTLPYLATSLSTVYLGWDLTKELPTGSSFYDLIVINHDTARYLLDVIEPLQLGYGAVIISFLGAIHWGLEYAEKNPSLKRTRFRYGIGVAASVVAWPTVMMPIEYGLTAQFAAFVALYFADARAATRGWAPAWYGTYRFLLTAMVGLAIFVSLVGRSGIERSQLLSRQHLRSTMNSPGLADYETDWAKLEAEEKKKIKKEKEEAERKAKKDEQKEKQGKKKEKQQEEKGKMSKGNQKENDKREGSEESEQEDKGDKDESQNDGKEKTDKSKNDGKEKKDKSGEDKAESEKSGEGEKGDKEDQKK